MRETRTQKLTEVEKCRERYWEIQSKIEIERHTHTQGRVRDKGECERHKGETHTHKGE